jgi:hypothetical protein
LFLKLVGALPATAYLSHGCGSGDPRYLTDIEHRVLTAYANAIFPAKSPAQAFRANIAELSGSRSHTTCSGAFSRTVPRTHSA